MLWKRGPTMASTSDPFKIEYYHDDSEIPNNAFRFIYAYDAHTGEPLIAHAWAEQHSIVVCYERDPFLTDRARIPTPPLRTSAEYFDEMRREALDRAHADALEEEINRGVDA